jgi:hypothetical protein
VVINTETLAVEEIETPPAPYGLAIVHGIQLQRPHMEPALSVEKLFVACRDGERLLAIDLETRKVVADRELPGQALSVAPVAMPNYSWWPLIDLDRFPIALTGRVAVALKPWSVSLPDLADPKPYGASPTGKTRSGVEVEGTKYICTNDLLLKVGDKLVDVSDVCDPQLANPQPLSERDEPGSITVAMDGGPEFDWMNDRWMSPRNQDFLVYGTDEFWHWNAQEFTVEPGEHVLKIRAKSPHANLDAVQVRRGVAGLDITFSALPEDTHGGVNLPGYQGVFYEDEPAIIEAMLNNRGGPTRKLRLSWQLHNYMGELVDEGRASGTLRQSGTDVPLRLNARKPGRYTLTLTATSKTGATTGIARFVRLPTLEHPRLFFGKEDLPAIRERMADYPALYSRYGEWLARQATNGAENYPERFLPPGLTRDASASAAPAEADPKSAGQKYGWRMYDLGWRMFALQFMATMSDHPDVDTLAEAIRPLVEESEVGGYCQFHHHGPFFPGAAASLYDMATAEQRAELPMGDLFRSRMGSMDVMPWMLVAIEEPITPDKRAMVYKIMQYANLADTYFETHNGSRAGTLWQNPWTGCHCPLQGISLAYMFTGTFFGEDRIYQKPQLNGVLTFNQYVDPISDKRRYLPAINTPNGEPWRWLHGAMGRHPLEQGRYPWKEWIGKLQAEGLSDDEVDDLFALEGMGLKGELAGNASYYATGAAVPIGLALGWYDPDADTVTREEIPPTALFDFEGWAAMKSGWDGNATEVGFISGARDHANRQQPNHFTIIKGGDILIGTPSLYGDDGNSTPAWGNVVAIGDDYITGWRRNLWDPRSPERLIINRYSPETYDYMARDRSLTGFQPAEGGWGGGLDLHGHTHTPLWGRAR